MWSLFPRSPPVYDCSYRSGVRAPKLWREAARQAPATPAYLEEGPAGWSPVSWDEATKRIDFARAPAARARRPAPATALPCISGRTSVDWILLDWAIMSIGAVVVGLYPTSSAKECAYVLEHSEAVLAFAENDGQVRKLVSVRGSLPALREIVPFDLLGKLEAEGRASKHLQPEPVAEDDLATLI